MLVRDSEGAWTIPPLYRLNIVTPRWQSKWLITPLNDNSGFYLNGTTTDRWGTHEIAFVCPPKPAPRGAAKRS